ncbi:hypothetical protein QA3_01746 [Enterococcus faecalis EnGen0082]|nr:hypothetical protein Q9G_00630 [Enterococcus faecalis EnGen0076]EOE00725.1 hypothetical protein Q9K_01273 [Enterococcus faecalis EnGen0075]EOE15388.1 hypothetical protein Q9W_01851 [Enterococcus faecalis EnGen0060]EOE20966.1 hypothetical protein Q9Y_01985 [Enterococcus faecalis EnGen0081]EOE21907.1 hypothetical protein QA3_01746 [Enterococcus faecalis EnGen0082]EOE22053.1 hypothetical protein QA5_01861 [Enterococcus faecalis EnGen0083]EOE31097.1 hypothetical protein QAA_01876 [Enterococcus
METVTVATKSDLLTNLNKQTDEIIISEALAQEIYHLKKQQLTETEEMGFLVGSHIFNLFNREVILYKFGAITRRTKN